MKTAAILLLFIAAIGGCGSGTDNHGYGYHYDIMGETGIRVRYEPGQILPTLAEIERLYRETMDCTGLVATGPLVIFVKAIPRVVPDGPDIRGQTYLDTGTIIIATAINDAAASMTWTHKHEFVHYLLHQSGFPTSANAAHQSRFFLECPMLERGGTI